MYVNQKSTETKEGWYLSNKIKLTTSTYQPYISIVTFNVILNFDLTSSYLEYTLSLFENTNVNLYTDHYEV